MTDRLHVAPRPCATCPYVRATPPGIWHPDEYAKLPAYDEIPGNLATFGCHQQHHTGRPAVCRGWLGVHRDGIAVRLAVATGRLDLDDVPLDDDPTLYGSGGEAAAAGLAAIEDPPATARKAARKLLDRGGVRL